ncbi:MAG: tRNA uridine-5-carboxymethylaminomethyl(34) synthesis GTPase MnmE [Firmicutes bacterium]|nr:tRNA uridine-5-carboxymethylaminomethyl(34) synthesis GTPase MnmE [Candidatus Fiminaster equi]
MFETIVALATPPSKSALALIRLSGDDCFKVVSKVFSKDLTDVKEKGIHYGYILEGEKQIDQVVLLAYVAPHSFTGENSVEIISHGSMLIVNQIIGLLLKSGARMATNGEFSSRAYLNGKIDLVQAEAINDMINATTEEAKDLSMVSLLGKTSKIFKPIKDEIGEILSHIEVNIDYPEYEDIEVTSKEEIINKCSKIVKDVNKLIEQGEKDRIYKEGVKIAIVGKPNVGKSSLLNVFLKEDKAIVTDIAGTTRDIVEGEFNLSGVPVHLYDTAGLRESTDVIEQIGISKAKKVIDEADLILFLVDDTGFDNELYSFIKDKKHLVVFSKADLISNKEKDKIYISAKENDISELVNRIKEELNIGEVTIKPSFNNTRQLGILKSMVMYLEQAIEDAKDNQPIDLISVNIMAAYNSSLDLLGENNKNDLTDEIFSRFCVGK